MCGGTRGGAGGKGPWSVSNRGCRCLGQGKDVKTLSLLQLVDSKANFTFFRLNILFALPFVVVAVVVVWGMLVITVTVVVVV